MRLVWCKKEKTREIAVPNVTSMAQRKKATGSSRKFGVSGGGGIAKRNELISVPSDLLAQKVCTKRVRIDAEACRVDELESIGSWSFGTTVEHRPLRCEHPLPPPTEILLGRRKTL
ncbi:unnamed protein product [Gongylonema pulchrum]|uniref:Uncharacterized protein n=1 Tax=Gongylonema pulchrum TaxID=637853 RepID=A0A183DU48_9BILA|nr:unnamed protein product [Gongylonema pulchrum]